MSPDSVGQLAQARQGVFNDWNPPIMSWVWRPLDKLYPGPAGMLAFHNLLFWSGLGIFCSLEIRSSILAPLAILAVGFFPPVFALLGSIWKDVGLGVSLVLATALLLRAHRLKSKTSLAWSLLPLFYGLAVRHNAGAAVLPLAVWAGAIGLELFGLEKGRVRGAAAGLAVFSALSALVLALNLSLVQGQMNHMFQQTLVLDLAAISLDQGVMRLPACALNDGQSAGVGALRAIFSPYDVTELYLCEKHPGLCVKPCSGRELPEVLNAWRRAVLDRPGAYLRHRLQLFAALVSRRPETDGPWLMSGIVPNQLGVEFHRTPLNDAVTAFLARAKSTLVFRAWVYLAALPVVLLFGWALSPRRDPLVLALATSGMLYEGFYLLAAMTTDFRYSWWTILAALLLAPAALKRLARR